MKIYISGAITGDKNYEEKFSVAEKWLFKKYYDVNAIEPLEIVNPVKLSRELEKSKNAEPDSLTYAEYMKNDIKALLECDRLMAIPGFERSAGAMLEINIALATYLVVGQISEEDFNIALDEYKKEKAEEK